jgi:A/G-specific adenine glycosylase
MSLPKQSAKETQRIARAIVAWGKTNYRDYPWRKTPNRFHAIIAEIMLQRTRAEQVLDVYNGFTRKYKTPEDVCSDSYQNILATLRPLGLNWRAKIITDFSAQTKKMGSIPNSFDELTKLPGVGQYIASAFLSFHNNQRCPLIDANTVRIWGRICGFRTDADTRRKKWFRELADNLTPKTGFKEFNYSLLDFGSLICKAIPLCKVCPINKTCCYFKNNHVRQSISASTSDNYNQSN